MASINKKVCFFSTEGLATIQLQQYSLQDINILRDLGFNIIIASKFSEIPWDCSFYFSWWASGSILPLIVAKITRKPLFVVAGGNEAMLYKDSVTNEPLGYLNTPLYKKIATLITLKFANEVIVVSKFMQHGIKKLTSRKTLLMYNSVNAEKFFNKRIPRIYITSIFNMELNALRLKRAEILLKAIPKVLAKYPDQKFILIGKFGNGMQYINNLIKNLKIEDNIILTGPQGNNNISEWMNKSLAYVQISDTETFGVSIAEAMCCETPVIVSKRGAIPEVVGKNGIYVDHNNSQSVAKGILHILENAELINLKIGLNLRNRILNSFSYESRKKVMTKMLLQYNINITI